MYRAGGTGVGGAWPGVKLAPPFLNTKTRGRDNYVIKSATPPPTQSPIFLPPSLVYDLSQYNRKVKDVTRSITLL